MAIPVELYASHHVLIGMVETEHLRFSDYLNRAAADEIILQDAWLGDLARPEAAPLLLLPATVRKRDVLLAAPLDVLGPAVSRPSYVLTVGTRIAASIGPYMVTGMLHAPARAPFDLARLFGAQSRMFVPLTEAALSHVSGAPAQYPTILVRVDRAAFAGPVGNAGVGQAFLRAALHHRLRVLAGSGDS